MPRPIYRGQFVEASRLAAGPCFLRCFRRRVRISSGLLPISCRCCARVRRGVDWFCSAFPRSMRSAYSYSVTPAPAFGLTVQVINEPAASEPARHRVACLLFSFENSARASVVPYRGDGINPARIRFQCYGPPAVCRACVCHGVYLLLWCGADGVRVPVCVVCGVWCLFVFSGVARVRFDDRRGSAAHPASLHPRYTGRIPPDFSRVRWKFDRGFRILTLVSRPEC